MNYLNANNREEYNQQIKDYASNSKSFISKEYYSKVPKFDLSPIQQIHAEFFDKENIPYTTSKENYGTALVIEADLSGVPYETKLKLWTNRHICYNNKKGYFLAGKKK